MKAISEGSVKVAWSRIHCKSGRIRTLETEWQSFYTAIIPNARAENLMPIIEEQVEPDGIVYTDSFKAYNALDMMAFYHYRINHGKLFADYGNYINGIENFWNQTKLHLRRFNAIKREHFCWFLKEYKWRFNGSDHKSLLTGLNNWVKQAQK